MNQWHKQRGASSSTAEEGVDEADIEDALSDGDGGKGMGKGKGNGKSNAKGNGKGSGEAKANSKTNVGNTKANQNEGSSKPTSSKRAGGQTASDPDDNSGKKPRSEIDGLISKATGLKKRYHDVMSKCQTVKEMIESKSRGWEWADNPHNLGKLTQKIRELQGSLSEVQFRFLASTTGSFKKLYTAEVVLIELKAFLGLEPNVKACESMYSRLTEMARAAAESHD